MLDASGLVRLTVHRRASGPSSSVANVVDEQVTGGVLTNLYNLFQGVFDWGSSPHDAAPYEAVVNRGGVVIEVRASDPEGRDAADRMLAGLATLRTEWRDEH
jgi:hypothetical protein